jgi:hypothetical protein
MGRQRSGIVMVCLLKMLITKYPGKYDRISLEQDPKKQFSDIVNFILYKRPQAFAGGWRVNFEKTFYRFYNVPI